MEAAHRPFGERSGLIYRALADSNRRRLLRLLDDEGPLEVKALSERIGLHPNTVRQHLSVLAEAGLVTRRPEERTRPGRPRMLYEAGPGETRSAASDGYRFLAEVLAGYMAATLADPAGAAEEAGRTWGQFLVDRPAPYQKLDPAEVVERILATLAELGFDPEEHRDRRRIVIRLNDCPFRDLARQRGNVVCSVHLGILRGMAEALGDSVSVEGLQPFVEPALCTATLSASDSADTR
ncbi:MAG: helix-turn-helix domain-containing protein [Acidimicrobiia bacterium]